MITLASIEEIEAYLIKSKEYIKEKRIRLIPRKKSMETLNNLGISIYDAFTMVQEMTYKNYYRGPSKERDNNFPPGEVWEFGIEVELDRFQDVYVKLKNEIDNENIICLSFHESEYPINYPYKNTKRWEDNI